MTSTHTTPPVHWADINAEKIIREKGPLGVPGPDGKVKTHYTCASGITPSGTVHIGNFREIISVELVVRALRERGSAVRFLYSWDDYDVFRKVPNNLPSPQEFEKYLRQPITLVPDPWGRYKSYAGANEAQLEELLPCVGIEPEYIYQAHRYRSSRYAEGIRTALEKREVIREILNEHRTTPLPEDWWPVSVFSGFTNRDTTTVLGWDGEWNLTYRCDETGNTETVDLRETPVVKLPWRIDWPMRWAFEGVDFEPAGKDHHSEGGSFDTARVTAQRVYGFPAPVTFQYDFISIKGRGGKISSSSGEVIGLNEVLEIYQPEVVRYLFAGTKPNAEFAISFDLDVIKIYEDYDKCERIYYGLETVGEKRAVKEKRIYELSQVHTVSRRAPVQVPFRHLSMLVQITDGNIEKALEMACAEAGYTGELGAEDRERLQVRARCALNWVAEFAPEEFRFRLQTGSDPVVELTGTEREAVDLLLSRLETDLARSSEKELSTGIYDVAKNAGLDPKDFFRVMYRVLTGKDQGPRLAGFLHTIGIDRALEILSRYRLDR
jgi:lysyl-tRNA synthetase, class I